jgi:hypothetical protein
VLEHGDVGGGLWCELPPLHAGADEPEERIHGILWVEDARSSSSLGWKRLLHKRGDVDGRNFFYFVVSKTTNASLRILYIIQSSIDR